MLAKVGNFIKKDAVLAASFVLAVVSSCIVLPDKEYARYIDFRTLSLLFCLMGVMAGLQKIGVFEYVAGKLLKRVKSFVMLALILMGLCFVFGMLITNDVALITFVPFTFMALDMTGKKDRWAVPLVVLETIASNMGSMFTPIGNPQNLYLYGISGMSVMEFLKWMAPYTGLAFALLLAAGLLLGRKEKDALSVKLQEKKLSGNGIAMAVYLVFFALALLTVAHVLPYYVTLAVTVAAFLATDREILKKIDYSLLLTFVCFFVFIGNMGRLPAFATLLGSIVEGHEVYCGVAFSQFISNVPAALLLSGFSGRYPQIIIGVNIGGLGTLIASMASLISYKLLVKELPEKKSIYFRQFTLYNIGFLIVFLLFYRLVG